MPATSASMTNATGQIGEYTVEMNCLFAVHLSDGLMSNPWWVGGWIVTAVLLFWACRRFPESEIPRTALLTAAIYVSSSFHLRLGRTSAHLLLNGLAGTMLGKRLPLAVVIGLVLQAVLLNHGGYYILGLNAVIITLPGLIVPRLFRFLLSDPLKPNRAFVFGALTGSITVLVTISLHAFVLIAGGIEDFSLLAGAGFLAHLPLAVLEGVMLATICRYLAVVRPELLFPDRKSIRLKGAVEPAPPSTNQPIT